MILKNGVNLNGLKPECLLGIYIASEVWMSYGYELTLTSVTDSKHQPGSLHYVGLAFDCRIKDLPIKTPERIVIDLKEKFNKQWDVVMESDHIHIEYQPKIDDSLF